MSKSQQPVISINKKEEDALSKSKIEVIKNLIFGENIQEYNTEFDKLKKEILEKKKALEELIEEVRTDLKASIDDVSTDVNVRITDLEESLTQRIEAAESDIVHREELGKLLIQLGEKISK